MFEIMPKAAATKGLLTIRPCGMGCVNIGERLTLFNTRYHSQEKSTLNCIVELQFFMYY